RQGTTPLGIGGIDTDRRVDQVGGLSDLDRDLGLVVAQADALVVPLVALLDRIRGIDYRIEVEDAVGLHAWYGTGGQPDRGSVWDGLARGQTGGDGDRAQRDRVGAGLVIVRGVDRNLEGLGHRCAALVRDLPADRNRIIPVGRRRGDDRGR